MGEIHVAGPDAVASVERLVTCNGRATLATGEVQLRGSCCNERRRHRRRRHRLPPRRRRTTSSCVNASNIAKDFALGRAPSRGARRRRSRIAATDSALLALQGPARAGDPRAASPTCRPRGAAAASASPRATSRGARCSSRAPATPARTASSSTSPPTTRRRVWNALLEAARRRASCPAGLGARDTLRLEATLAALRQRHRRRRRRRSRRTSAGSSSSTRRLHRREALARAEGAGAHAQARRLRASTSAASPAHGYPLLHGGRERSASSPRGAPSPTLGQGHRPRLRSAGARGRRDTSSRSTIRGRATSRPSSCRPRSTSDVRVGSLRRGVRRADDERYPDDLHYIEEARVGAASKANRVTIGITDYAQKQLGDIVFVELPAVGDAARERRGVRRDRVGQGRLRALRAGRGEIVEVNDDLADAAGAGQRGLATATAG